MKKKKTWITIVIIGIVAIGGLYVFAQSNVDDTELTGPDMVVTSVNRTTLETTITAQGEVFVSQSEVATINNTLEVDEIHVRENDIVEQGQELMTFITNTRDRQRERERLQNQLQDMGLTLRSQEVTLENLRLAPSALELENARLNINRAYQGIDDAHFAVEQVDSNISLQQRAIEQILVSLTDAKNTLDTTEVLFAAGVATQLQLGSAERAVENIEIELSSAQERIATLQSQRTQTTQAISTAEATLRMAYIQLEDLETRVDSPQNLNAIAQQEIAIERTRLSMQEIQRNINNLNDVESVLTSPISGTITRINVVRGAVATQGSPLVEITDADAHILRAFVNERHAALLSNGQEVLIEGSILANLALSGRVQSVGTVATITTIAGVAERTVPIEISLNPGAPSGILLPGVTLDVTITTEVRENVLAVPILSTLRAGDDSFVFVVNEDNTIERRVIELITYADMLVEVRGLYEDEVILLQPSPSFVEGMLINPIHN